MSTQDEEPQAKIFERDFIEWLSDFLEPALGLSGLSRDPRLGRGRPNFIGQDGTRDVIIEATAVTPQARSRISAVGDQLLEYREQYIKLFPTKSAPRLVLAVPLAIGDALKSVLSAQGVELLDGPKLEQLANQHGASPLPGFISKRERPSRVVRQPDRSQRLEQRLAQLAPGRTDATEYQRVCSEILELLFCPPLNPPIWENADEARVNRRDIVFPNYSTSGFWNFLLTHYSAYYIVTEIKNYAHPIKKAQVLQTANYLNLYGAGSFGLLIARNGADRSARQTCREQWILHRKMILVLTGADLQQMLLNNSEEVPPENIIRQTLEDFRLAI